jgi:hypothetical protein
MTVVVATEHVDHDRKMTTRTTGVTVPAEAARRCAGTLGHNKENGDDYMRWSIIVIGALLSVALSTLAAQDDENDFKTYAAREAKQQYESTVNQAKQRYIERLRSILNSLPPGSQLEEANRISAVIKQLQQESTQMREDAITMLIGAWNVSNVSGNYHGVWNFKQDGTFTSTSGTPGGKWQWKKDRIAIAWRDGRSGSFATPIDKTLTHYLDAAGNEEGTATKVP